VSGQAARGQWRRLVVPGLVLTLAVLLLALTAALSVTAAAAHQVSISNLGIPVEAALAFAVVGLLVARRQPANPVGWLLALTAVCILVTGAAGEYALLRYHLGHEGLPFGRAVVVTEAVSGPLPEILLPVAVLLFPDGRLPSRRWRWALRIIAVVSALYLVSTFSRALGAVLGHPVQVDGGGTLVALDHAPAAAWQSATQVLAAYSYPLVWLLVIVRQVVAWRRSGGERRQQLKWLMSGACVAGFALVGFSIVDALPGAASSAAVQSVDNLFGLLLAALPVSIGVAILRYRLYDIDRLVSRTVAYTLVTGLLVGVYAGLVLLATQVLRFSSPVAVAAATLVAVALLRPVRRRVQRVVDRRFNRARYDADAAMAAFADRLREAVDLDSIRGELASAVYLALEPDRVLVWMPGGDQ